MESAHFFSRPKFCQLQKNTVVFSHSRVSRGKICGIPLLPVTSRLWMWIENQTQNTYIYAADNDHPPPARGFQRICADIRHPA